MAFLLGVDTPPMEAKTVARLPDGPGWQFEPTWDGFRCLAFKAGSEVDLRPKSGKSLARHFPEMVAALDQVGFNSAISDADRLALTRRWEAMQDGSGLTGDAPGGPSRRSTEQISTW